jgi:hypothetical protein
MLIRCLIVVLFVSMMASTACTRKDGEHKAKTNALKDYVNTPLDKARGAKGQLEESQDRLKKQAELLEQ